MAGRNNSKVRRQAKRQAKRHAARRQVRQTDQGQQDMFPKTGKMCVGYAVGLKKLAEIRRSL
jgi:hypothetical protein